MFTNPQMKCTINFTEAAKFSHQRHKFHFFILVRYLISFAGGGGGGHKNTYLKLLIEFPKEYYI